MRFKKNFLHNYLINAPMALAIERSLECNIFSEQEFIPPILDIGCGDGLFAHILFDGTINTGVDFNAKELKRAKSFKIYDEIINCHADKIPKDDSSYNTIFSNSVLEHIPNLKSVLSEVYRLLAPGGNFYVTVPTEKFDRFTILYQLFSLLHLSTAAQNYRRFFNKFWKHYNHYKIEKWEAIFKQAGFKVITSKEYGSKVLCLINDFLVPLALVSFVVKKILNKWIIFRRLRGVYIYPFYFIISNIIKRYENGSQRGLIFFSLAKE